MPQLKWEWSFGPQTIIGALSLIALIVGFIGVWYEMRADVAAAKDKAVAVEIRATQLQEHQAKMGERVVRVETKLDLMLPAIERIETRQIRQQP